MTNSNSPSFNLIDVIHQLEPTDALANISPETNKMEHNKMTEQTLKDQLDETVDASAVAAEALLKEDGWAILRELYKTTAAALNATSVVVVPALERRDEILNKLSDPAAFSKDLQNCMTDIEQMIGALEALSEHHVNKTGVPDLADMDLISKLTLGYANLQHQIETAIQPLLLGLINKMQEAEIDTVSFVK